MNISGIYTDFHTTKVCHLKKRGSKFEFSFETDPKECKGKIVSALNTKQFLIRNTELKTANSKHIKEAIAFQSEASHHFKSDEVISVPVIQKKEKEKVEALVFTAPKLALTNHLNHMLEIGVVPDAVSTTATALTHFILWKFPKIINAFIVDLGSLETSCIFIQNGQLKKSHSIEGGVEKLLNSLLEDRKRVLLKKEIEGTAKQIDLLLLKPGLNPNLSAQLSALRQKINQIYLSFCKLPNVDVIFTGRTDAFIHLTEFLLESSEYKLTPQEEKFAIPIGLTIEHTSKTPLQLLVQEFFPQKNWKKLGVYAASFAFSSLVLNALIFSYGSYLISSKKNEMVKATYLPSKGTQTVESWIKTIENNNKEYPYILQAPTVTESLAWLTYHPLLEELAKEGDPIDIKSIRYRLTSYPTVENPKIKYEAKMEIEFSLKNGISARKFREAIMNGDNLIMPNEKIVWDTLSNSYRTEVTLKNRGPYVP